MNWGVIGPLMQKNNYQAIYNWPDAMANAFFIDKFADAWKFQQYEPLNATISDIVHPRSLNIINHNFVPAGFLGFLILYGLLAKIIGHNLILYLTPLTACVGVVIFYLFVKELINKRAALISSALLALFAPYIFFANQTMLATIPFLVLALSGFLLIIRYGGKPLQRNSMLALAGSGLLISGAMCMRYQESIWLIMCLLIIWFVQFKKIEIKKILVFFAGLIIPIIVILIYNKLTYDAFFTVGYLRMNNIEADIAQRLPAEINVNAPNNFISYLKLIFLPFGFSLRNIYHNVLRYIWLPYSPYIVLCAIGGLIWSTKFTKIVLKQKIFALCVAVSSGFLIIYYGSWIFVDPMVLQNNVISSSYTRYWLPIFVMIIPLLGYLFDAMLSKAIKRICTRTLLVYITMILLVFISITRAFTAPNDGLVAEANATQTYYERAIAVRKLIEPNALVVVEREDKLFFPTYKTITFEHDYSIFSEINRITNEIPVYYFCLNNDNDIKFINDNKLKPYKLFWNKVTEIDSNFRLYKLHSINESGLQN